MKTVLLCSEFVLTVSGKSGYVKSLEIPRSLFFVLIVCLFIVQEYIIVPHLNLFYEERKRGVGF